jgi:Protein of unknown function (DUF2924)
MAQWSTDLAAIEAEIERIRSLGLDALRARWRSMFGAVPPAALTKDLLVRIMAYRLQEEAFGGLDRATIKLQDGMARGEKPGTAAKRRLKAGTVLVREYRSELHTVTVVEDGFVWRGTTYASLSTIARAITGTAWGGPRFFGLRSPDRNQQCQEPTEPLAKPQQAGRGIRAGIGRAEVIERQQAQRHDGAAEASRSHGLFGVSTPSGKTQ